MFSTWYRFRLIVNMIKDMCNVYGNDSGSESQVVFGIDTHTNQMVYSNVFSTLYRFELIVIMNKDMCEMRQ